jgi:hypothetical protein
VATFAPPRRHEETTVARLPRRALTTGLAALLLPACGGGGGSGPSDNGEASKPADQILKDSVAALRGAESVHMYGEIPTGTETLAMDLHYNRSGNLKGTITIGTVPAEVIITGGHTFLKGRALFARYGGDQAATVIGDHWVAVPAGSGPGSDIVQGLATFTDFNKLADLLASPTGGAVTKGAASTVDGRSVIALRDSDSVLYIATTGKAYPIELKPDAASKALHLGSWDEPVDVTAPRDSLDFSSLAAGSPEAGPSASPTP